ncbi:PREDICTED: polycomb group protein EMBRYONIC FLOWER 2-like isoform X1 [Nicotiana attenuata]|uniref:Polycomb group protein embryonic flower 2 n=2 Tax=Nicotiana attenuata TaxID=49451 RepID=A0A314KPQ7_NICAT|nr:PREDICTED: polycomb group protein EMBRYONIC FLOWER 2-like isoform X1 [Nicotiana attenuata]XP_019227806.1 PREDICTED: polycomb group protein EMBRYONIC FLOWER 2-like isoform X1 [Nicotiana attenuata]XP_019227807.1 PREDICTED: polycomb group protein EMBRYONIC FLOWER 2-like isoform X1 [Nicotiana attenuata]XP_019227808.1 PREDICTED: polycomb group protein EMBRYONIC FLOWER 2-like isoform X1 [Nicotiana attenuata]OIT31147.1 polycomb group protein embryonic flower 2 [Nicotiana attenuata]
MPGIPLVARETTHYTCYCSYSTVTDSMCRQDFATHLSAEERIAAEESLSTYCKPVELYNILQRRAVRNPSFLQRCLHYKIQAKHKKRIQMAISVPATVNDESQVQSVFPLCVILARPVSNTAGAEAHSAVYQFRRACISTSFTGVDGINRAQAKFFLPEMDKLSAEIRAGSLVLLFVSFAELARDHLDTSSFPLNLEGHCLLGRMPMELLHLLWEKSPNLCLGERAEMLSTVDLSPCFMKTSCLDKDRHISFQYPRSSAALATIQQLQVKIAAEEVGAGEKSAYDSFSYDDIPTTSLPRIIRLRTGNVVFNYRYYNNKLQRTEVTEGFTCPLCLVKCASFKGLRYHLCSSHDLFNFEFWVNEEYQAVNVSVRSDMWRSEIVANGVDPKQQTFFFCSKPLRRRKRQDLFQNSKYVHPLVLDSDFPTSTNGLNDKINGVAEAVECDPSSPNGAGVSSATGHLYPDPDSVQSVPGSTLAPPALLQFAKSRKLSVERSDPRNRALLQKRQFFHSHRAQPMALEQVLSDRDSEDEVDDDVADLEDRRMLDDFVDVTKDEKQMMHLWNSFVRKQRVLADGHIPWACEAFSKLHGEEFARAPALLWCWRLFMIKLWNHGLIDARGINNCNLILEQFQSQDNDSTRS